MTGHFNHKKEIHLGPRSRGDGDVGFYIVTPFITTGPDGKEWTVLVNRGFVPRAIKDAPLRPESLPNGTFTIEGLIRKGERNSVGLLTKVNTAKNMWTWMDLKTAGEWTGAKDFFLVEMVQGEFVIGA